MDLLSTFETFYLKAKQNRWYWLFALFCRVSLAFAFFAAGMVKVVDERFANGLSELHPMGAYLTALHETGYYYTFIGYAQILAAVLLIIPRTVLLGALIYFPIIVNIWILSFAVRFDGSFVTSPLMVLANLYIILWHYDKLQYILPFKRDNYVPAFKRPEKYALKFPFVFAGVVILAIASTLLFASFGYEVMPRNTIGDCQSQFTHTNHQVQGYDFCECIHEQGLPLDTCLARFEKDR